jgi:predicted MarR family transcription regulator
MPGTDVDEDPIAPGVTAAIADLRDVIPTLGHPDDRGYSLGVQRLVRKHQDDFVPAAEQLLTDFEGALADDPDQHRPTADPHLSDEARLGFAAWYGLIFLHRRRKNYEKVAQLVERDREHFRHIALAKLMDVELIARQPHRHGGLDHGFELHAAAHEVLGEHLSLSHFLAGQLHLTRAETTLDPDVRSVALDRALHAFDRAWSLRRDYGRPLQQKAMVHLLREEYAQALEEIDRAIEVEDSTTIDYSIRLADYQATRLNVLWRQQLVRIERAQHHQEMVVADIRNQFVDLIALIGLVIALLSVTVNLSRSIDPSRAVMLFLAAGGVMLIVFAGFRAMLSTGRSDALRVRTLGTALGIGSVMLVIAFLGTLLLPG